MEGDLIKINKYLLPLSWLYGIGTGIRNLLFEAGLLKSREFTIPVISVGNITVGGSGKTPHVEYLIRLLQDKQRVAVLSRGYKRKSRGYQIAKAGTTADDIGDEPYQMWSKFGPDIHVAVDANRCEGIDNLRSGATTKDTDVILLDDAFQHRYVKPGVNILLVDYHRLIAYDQLLPAGRLRESKGGKSRADVVIITKCPKDLRPMDYRVVSKAMALYPYQKLFFTTLSYSELYGVFPEAEKFSMADIKPEHNILVLTGIASPQHLLKDLATHSEHITPLSFGDHHRFTSGDIAKINNLFDALPQPRIIITTEKDAARLVNLDGLSDDVREHIYAQPIQIEFLLDQGQEFDEYILNYIQTNSKNSILSKMKNEQQQSQQSTISFLRK